MTASRPRTCTPSTRAPAICGWGGCTHRGATWGRRRRRWNGNRCRGKQGYRMQRKAAVESFGIDVEAVFRGARARGENAVAAVGAGHRNSSRRCGWRLMTNEVIVRIQAEAESSGFGGAAGARLRKRRARGWLGRRGRRRRPREAGIGDIDGVYTAVRSREEDRGGVCRRVEMAHGPGGGAQGSNRDRSPGRPFNAAEPHGCGDGSCDMPRPDRDGQG